MKSEKIPPSRKSLPPPPPPLCLVATMRALAKWGAAAFIKKVNDHNKKQREDLLALLRGMYPGKFESFVAEVVLPAMGFEECVATQRSHDRGIDAVGQLVIHNSVRVNVAVQIKRYGKT